MTKLPVGKTVATAYAFAVNNLGAIVGLIWIPMLIVTVVSFFAQSTYIDAMIAYTADRNVADLGPGFMWMLMFIFIALLGNAMMMVPVLQLAMGTRQGPVLYHFSLGPLEWRMFGAYLALFGIILVLAFAAALIDAVATQAVLSALGQGAATAPAVMIGASIAMLVLLVLFVVAIVRLAIFIPAVTTLEEKIDLRRGWMIANGNVLRLMAVVLLCVLPVVLVYLGIQIALFGPGEVLPHMGDAAAEPSLEQLRASRSHLPMAEALGFFIAPLTVGLNAGVVVAAYRALTVPKPAETP